MPTFDLSAHDIQVQSIGRNLPPPVLYEEALRYEPGATLTNAGALVAYSGDKTGRSPKDKRVVKQPPSEADIWWGPVNVGMEPQSFFINRERARDYLNTRSKLYCMDGYA